MARLTVWRHGRTHWNAAGRFQGQADPPLDPVGEEQARQAARYLAVDPPDLIVCSDLERATGTATALTALVDVPLRIDHRMREVDLGSWQGLTRAEVLAAYPEQYATWLAGKPPADRGGETRVQLDRRVLAALREIDVDHALLITHGGTSRSIIESLLGLPHQAGRWLAVLGNCHWSQLKQQPAGWQLTAHNLASASDAVLSTADSSGREGGDADAVEPRVDTVDTVDPSDEDVADNGRSVPAQH